jgi:Tfp pilus assembly protein PilW
MKRLTVTAAFTLPELMVAAAISSLMIGGLITGTVALQKGYAAADYSIRCQLDQMRVIDYITRDLRRARSVATENLGRKLVVTLPDQWNPVTQTLRVPAVSDGVVRYGGDPIVVSYYIEGDLFIREEGGVRQAIAYKRLENFLVSLNPAQMVTFQLAFTPIFSAGSGYGAAASTIVTTVPLPRGGGDNE